LGNDFVSVGVTTEFLSPKKQYKWAENENVCVTQAVCHLAGAMSGAAAANVEFFCCNVCLNHFASPIPCVVKIIVFTAVRVDCSNAFLINSVAIQLAFQADWIFRFTGRFFQR